MVIVKHETHHLHDFVLKFVIFNVNRVNFYQEQCTVTLIQRKRRSKIRLGAETIAALLLTRRSCLTLTRCSCSRCECTHLLTCTPKKIRAAHAPLTLAVWNGRKRRLSAFFYAVFTNVDSPKRRFLGRNLSSKYGYTMVHTHTYLQVCCLKRGLN